MDVTFISPQTIKLDLLHMVDLGIAAHLYGNLIWDLLEDHTVEVGQAEQPDSPGLQKPPNSLWKEASKAQSV